jgi:hypothetical protein
VLLVDTEIHVNACKHHHVLRMHQQLNLEKNTTSLTEIVMPLFAIIKACVLMANASAFLVSLENTVVNRSSVMLVRVTRLVVCLAQVMEHVCWISASVMEDGGVSIVKLV